MSKIDIPDASVRNFMQAVHNFMQVVQKKCKWFKLHASGSKTICKRSKRNASSWKLHASGINFMQVVKTIRKRSKLYASGQNYTQAVWSSKWYELRLHASGLNSCLVPNRIEKLELGSRQVANNRNYMLVFVQ